jgi:hypothetical protein
MANQSASTACTGKHHSRLHIHVNRMHRRVLDFGLRRRQSGRGNAIELHSCEYFCGWLANYGKICRSSNLPRSLLSTMIYALGSIKETQTYVEILCRRRVDFPIRIAPHTHSNVIFFVKNRTQNVGLPDALQSVLSDYKGEGDLRQQLRELYRLVVGDCKTHSLRFETRC